MRIDRRLILIGVILVVLSMTMATQYATTKISYSFGIVHPSNADIRFIGSDNSSGDSKRCLRINDNSSGNQFLSLELGDWFPNSTKKYTAAFGVVNEEQFTVNITYVNLSGDYATNVDVWIHSDRDADYTADGATMVKIVDDGINLYNSADCVWKLGAGNGVINNMCADASTQITTYWDDTSDVSYSTNDANNSVNGTSDFVWFGVSLDIAADATLADATGTLYVYFEADTI